MKRSDELRRSIANLTDRMEPLASKEGLTAAEQGDWNRVMAKGGELERLQTELDEAIESERATAALRAARAATHTPTSCYDLPGQRASQPNILTPKLTAFTGNGNREQAARDAYDCGLWLLSTIHRDPAARQKLEARRGPEWVASQNESSPVDGGYLLPAPMEAAVINAREQISAIRKLATIYPMTSDTLKIPKESSGLTVYYPGEEGSITESDVDFGAISLIAKKRAVLTYISSELRDDSIIAIVDYVSTAMGHALGLKLDQEGIAGDGTSTYGGVQGIRPAIIAATASVFTPTDDHDAWVELTFDDFAGCMSLLSDKYRVPGQLAWLCSAAFKYSAMDRLAIGANGALSQSWVDGQPVEMFLGHPIVLSDRMPTTTDVSQVCCIFGNFRHAVAMGDRTGIRIALSEHVAFTTDRIALRATSRYDLNVHEEGTTSVAGAIVGLATHS